MATTRRVVLTLPLGLLAACAIGNTYDYAGSTVKAPETRARVLLAVTDRRPYVVSGDKTPNFIGLQRGGYGNPFDVTTSSGQPLAQDFSRALGRALEMSGARVSTVSLSAGATEGEAVAALARRDVDRFLLVEIGEWKTDVFAQLTVHWDLTAKVFDRAGRLVAENSISGSEGTGSAGFESENAVIAKREAERRLSELMGDLEVAAALRGV